MSREQLSGRSGTMQVVADANDLTVSVPLNVTRAIIRTKYPYDFFYSYDGTLNSWVPKCAPQPQSECTINLPAGTTTLYLRKPRKYRCSAALVPKDDLASYYTGDVPMQTTSDIIATLDVEFE